MSPKKPRASWAPRLRSRQVQLPNPDDWNMNSFCPSPHGENVANASGIGAGTRKRAATRKQTTSRKVSLRSSTVTATAAQPQVSSAVETICLDETPERNNILNVVQSKMGVFMESGSFLSSDEDEEKLKSNDRPSLNQVFISDDSDTEAGAISSVPKAGTSADTKAPVNDSEDLMRAVDTVLQESQPNRGSRQFTDEQMRNLEEYRKETEKLLEGAAILLEEFKNNRREKALLKQKEEAEKLLPKPVVLSCPICLETLTGQPAAATTCGHIFCKECISKSATSLKTCPTCREPINEKKIFTLFL